MDQARSNYLDQVSGGYIRPRASDPDKVGAVERIMLLEREAILCQTIYESTKRLGSDGAVVGEKGLFIEFKNLDVDFTLLAFSGFTDNPCVC